MNTLKPININKSVHYKDTDEIPSSEEEKLQFDVEDLMNQVATSQKQEDPPAVNIGEIPCETHDIALTNGGASLENESISSFTSCSWPNEEYFRIFQNLCDKIPAWKQLIKTPDDLEFRRLKGNSNAVYKVICKNKTPSDVPKALLYRRYE